MALSKLVNIVDNVLSESGGIPSVRVVTDSQYCIDCVTKWCKNWEKNGWRTYKGEHVKHSTIIKKCIAYISELEKKIGCKVEFKHVNSHTIPPKDKNGEEWKIWYGNYMADKMVNETMNESDGGQKTKFGKVIQIDWDGAILSSNDKPSTNTSANGKVVTLTW